MPCLGSLCLFTSHFLDFASSSFQFCFAAFSFLFHLQERLKLLYSKCHSSSFLTFFVSFSFFSSSLQAHSVRGVATMATFSVMSLFLRFWRRFPGVLLLCSCRLISMVFSSRLMMGFLWVRLYLWVLLYSSGVGFRFMGSISVLS